MAAGQMSVEAEDKDKDKDKDKEEASAEPPVVSTKKPAMVAFPDELTAMQVDCGTFHTGRYSEIWLCALPKLFKELFVTCLLCF